MSETPEQKRAADAAAGDALRGALDDFDRQERLYATKYAAEHGELPEGYRKCDECGELVLPDEYHHHERKSAYYPEAESMHVAHIHASFTSFNTYADHGRDPLPDRYPQPPGL